MNLVAIVGRPNVGKSTLFNRIIQQKEAIVEDTPGVTRDRIYGEADWNGKNFFLVDTGGFIPGTEDKIEKAIREQATIAIEEADVIIFLVDGREGVTPFDRDIATILRNSDKPIVLVVNKSDNPRLDLNSYEFYELSLGEPYPISALGGRSTGDFLDKVTSYLADSNDEEDDERLKIAVVGRPNVGKSSICNALLGKERMIVTDIAGTTRDSIDSTFKYYGEEMVLIDTAGLRRRSNIKENVEFYSTLRTARAINRCDVAVVVLDATLGLEDQDKKIINKVAEKRKGLLIAVNKWDLIEKDTNTAAEFTDSIREMMKTYSYIPVIYISALTKQRITRVPEMAKKIQERRKKRIPTGKLNRELLAVLAKTPPPAVQGRDLRINYITQVKTEPPVFAFFCNHPNYIPESYKRFVENSLRKMYDLYGVPVSFIFRKKNIDRFENE
jgi:GTP-binding protein